MLGIWSSVPVYCMLYLQYLHIVAVVRHASLSQGTPDALLFPCFETTTMQGARATEEKASSNIQQCAACLLETLKGALNLCESTLHSGIRQFFGHVPPPPRLK